MKHRIDLTKENIKVGQRINRHISNRVGVVTNITDTHFYIEWEDLKQFGSTKWCFEYQTDMDWTIVEEYKSPIMESPCRVCSKMNDNGIKVCWSCGNHP